MIVNSDIKRRLADHLLPSTGACVGNDLSLSWLRCCGFFLLSLGLTRALICFDSEDRFGQGFLVIFLH